MKRNWATAYTNVFYTKGGKLYTKRVRRNQSSPSLPQTDRVPLNRPKNVVRNVSKPLNPFLAPGIRPSRHRIEKSRVQRTRQCRSICTNDASPGSEYCEFHSPQNTRRRGVISSSYRPSKKSIPEDAGGTGQDHNYDSQTVWNYGDSHNDAGSDY